MPEEHELRFDGCKYRCYLKTVQGKTGPSFRVYCGKADPKCKVELHLPTRATSPASKIAKAAEQINEMQAILRQQAMKGQLKPATEAEVKLLLNDEAYKLPYERYVMAVRKADFPPGDFPINATTMAMHRELIAKALAAGMTVPEKVLAEYPGVVSEPETALPYHRMTIGKFINAYDLKVGDPVLVHARAFAKDKKPGLPKGVGDLAIVQATITGFFTGIIGSGEPMARLRAGKIIADSYGKDPIDPKSKRADALKGWEGVYSINEISYGEVHKRFIHEAMKAGKPIPAKVLQQYPEL